MSQISFIVPVYNEAEFILPFYYDLKKHVPQDFELIWIDDGSSDDTLEEIDHLVQKDDRVRCISLVRNFGKTSAIVAGLDHVQGDVVVIMNGNLQHPPSLLPKMLMQLEQGYDVVTAEATNAAETIALQRFFLDRYYRFLSKLRAGNLKQSIGEYRVLRNKVLDQVYKRDNGTLSEPFFVFTQVKHSSMLFEYPKCKPAQRKYSIQHLWRATKASLTVQHKPVVNGLVWAGFACTGIAMAAGLYQVLLAGGLNLWSFLAILVFFVGGIQLLVYSYPRKSILKQIYQSYGAAEYQIKEILEHRKMQQQARLSFN